MQLEWLELYFEKATYVVEARAALDFMVLNLLLSC